MYHVYSNYLDNGQKIPFLFPKLEGVYNFSFKNHKMWSRKTRREWGGERPSQTEGLEKKLVKVGELVLNGKRNFPGR